MWPFGFGNNMWPFGFGNKYPYTDFHELNLDWILERMRMLEGKVSSFIADTAPIIRDTVNKWLDDHPEATTTVEDGAVTVPKLNQDVKDYFIHDIYSVKNNNETLPQYDFYYVNANTGSDDNDGLTRQTPFKTLDHVFDIVRHGDPEIRIQLEGGQIYETNSYIFEGITIHFAVHGTGDAQIKFMDNIGDIAFYNCHVNASGSGGRKIVFTANRSIYFDGGSLWGTDFQFLCTLGFWGASAYITDSIVYSMYARSSNVWMYNSQTGDIDALACNIALDGTDLVTGHSNLYSVDTHVFIRAIGGTFTITGNTSIDMNDITFLDQGFYFSGCNVSILSTISSVNVSSVFDYGLHIKGGTLSITPLRLDAFNVMATTPVLIEEANINSISEKTTCTVNMGTVGNNWIYKKNDICELYIELTGLSLTLNTWNVLATIPAGYRPHDYFDGITLDNQNTDALNYKMTAAGQLEVYPTRACNNVRIHLVYFTS